METEQALSSETVHSHRELIFLQSGSKAFALGNTQINFESPRCYTIAGYSTAKSSLYPNASSEAKYSLKSETDCF